jgi:hypothetical protein
MNAFGSVSVLCGLHLLAALFLSMAELLCLYDDGVSLGYQVGYIRQCRLVTVPF